MHRNLIVILFITIMSTNLSPPDSLAQTSQIGKMYFSNKPFANDHANAMNEFKSSDFIYGGI